MKHTTCVNIGTVCISPDPLLLGDMRLLNVLCAIAIFFPFWNEDILEAFVLKCVHKRGAPLHTLIGYIRSRQAKFKMVDLHN